VLILRNELVFINTNKNQARENKQTNKRMAAIAAIAATATTVTATADAALS
jgi:hypothetical protein